MENVFETALVTGASAGLGEEFATQLAPRLDRVVLVARRKERLTELAESLKARCDIEVLTIEADLSKDEERRRVFGVVEEAGWRIDLLVNNAGLGDYGDFANSEWERNRAMLQVNVEALTHLCQLFLPTMLAAESGAIVNVSSLASTLPIPDFAVYAASKAYVSSFSEALRMEVRDHGIDVLAVCPGPVKTEFGAVAARDGSEKKLPGNSPSFYVPKQQVVREALFALEKGRARVYPGWKVNLAATGISLLPLVAIRMVMSSRPRRQKTA